MPPFGWKPSAETREKMRQAKLANPTRYWLGKSRSPMPTAWRKKIGDGNRGKPKPEGFGERIGAPRRGIPRPASVVAKMKVGLARPEAKAKMRASVLGKPCRHAKHPAWYNGRRFRSTYETRTAAALDALRIEWAYEPRRFDCGAFTYAPDFYLVKEDVYWEVKGWYGPDSRRKVEAFRRLYPDVALVVFDLTCLKMLEAAVKRAA